MEKKLRTLITPEIIESYGKACVEVANLLYELANNNYTRLIIPSRGAYPFYSGAIAAMFRTIGFKETHFIRTAFNLWLLPFTADWGGQAIGISSLQVRKFWVKTFADYLRRESSPFTKYYDEIVNIARNQLTINTSQLTLDKAHRIDDSPHERFVFLDTAISGKAICEIIDSFLDLNLRDFVIIMVADNNGLSLKPIYKTIIEREKSKGRLVQVNVKKIFSEDSSPLFNSGISSLVFPGLIQASFNEIPEFRNTGIAGGGIWFADSISQLKNTAPEINGLMGIILVLVSLGISKHLNNDDKWFPHLVESSVQDFLRSAEKEKFNPFNPENTKKIVLSRLNYKTAPITSLSDVTESHVLRMDLDGKTVDKIIKKIKRI